MLLPVALVSVLVGSPVPADAPPAALAPAPAPALAPAELAPAPAPAPTPAPAPSEVVVTVETTTAPTMVVTTTTVQEWPSQPAPIVVVTPSPAPPPLTLSPPAPTWGPVRPMPYVPPDAVRVQQTMRQHRRGAFVAALVGGVGMAATLGLQSLRVRGLQRCASQGLDVGECGDYLGMDYAFSRYGAVGMGMLVVGTTGAGVMLGNAAATRDVQLRGGDVRSRTGLKALGVVVIGAATAWMIGANLQLGRHEAQCDGDAGCLLRYRPLRFAANDGAALGVAAGAGMFGYALGYERQGRALMRLRAAPSLSARHAGASVSISF